MTYHERILLVGFGKMGSALLHGWVKAGVTPDSISVIDPFVELEIPEGVAHVKDVRELNLTNNPTVVVFAVKPQSLDKVVPIYKQYDDSNTAFLSIAAGKPISYFERKLKQSAIIRGMPNTPASIGQGITVLCSNDRTTSDQKKLCTKLMKSVGEVEWVSDEKLMDAVTGLSGSGPAYVFHLVEAMAEAGREVGLSKELSMSLARSTVAGSGALLKENTVPVRILRENVTSPGGTTAAALEVLMGNERLTKLMCETVIRATERSKKLA
ncbi:MAG: pyrroline-5-carboxylate reductase [Alphaproteobacteria bacterium]|jgi:pyrroline-5-carboxylate reductase|nr:pyrroline-5-carboxylate reductase [Alphaproteobacteria bacterium]PPR14349.1 MAG: Pyrroline-5-carboxylate reductase [Alphaproteobacteria bacterium MarineAlpha12_Bin1]|tara:strand:- start:1154 stop:1957 length:804 start_codon:yes stop_codon:yes gene_type:complete